MAPHLGSRSRRRVGSGGLPQRHERTEISWYAPCLLRGMCAAAVKLDTSTRERCLVALRRLCGSARDANGFVALLRAFAALASAEVPWLDDAISVEIYPSDDGCLVEVREAASGAEVFPVLGVGLGLLTVEAAAARVLSELRPLELEPSYRGIFLREPTSRRETSPDAIEPILPPPAASSAEVL